MAIIEKLVMPKGDGRLDIAVCALKIYYEANDWLSNDEFKVKFLLLDNKYDSNTNEAMIIHKARTARYFGLIKYLFKSENGVAGRQGKITEPGKRFYEACLSDNKEAQIDTIMDAICNYSFGRNNYATSDTNSDVEPPKVLIKASYELGYVTKNEFVYLMYSMHDLKHDYSDVILEIKKTREDNIQVDLPQNLEKQEKAHFINVYGDWKFIQLIREVGILKDLTERAVLTDFTVSKYAKTIKQLSPLNNELLAEVQEESLINTLSEDIVLNIINKPYNRILFGAPGTGKSYKIEEERMVFGKNYERVTFYLNYSYSQFVGNYKPKPKLRIDGTEYVSYEFVPGPFLRTWTKAQKSIKNGNSENYLLIVEEINRANAAAVFGDVFQLLDRNDEGISEYEITTSEDMREYLIKKCEFTADEVSTIKIPRNMYIWSTMNSADQGVLPMDSAFKRRWNFEYIGINEGSAKIKNSEITLKSYGTIKWDILRTKINNGLISAGINEDKLIGPFFLSEKELKSSSIDEIFKSKLLMYLFEDVLKHRKGKLFKSKLDTFSKVIETYNKGEEIFDFDVMFSLSGEPSEESALSLIAGNSEEYSTENE
ncbi:AAA family ATPase [Clostridium sp.]|uniref:AAA family ATPase n=1 Tax=Clostridium sp. TaxID=1506 RepID=UPI003D6D5420